VFWIMKMTSSPTPESEAIAPPLKRRAADADVVLLLGLSWTMQSLLAVWDAALLHFALVFG